MTVLMLVAAVLIAIGYFIAMNLQEAGRLDDCLVAGRKECPPIKLHAESDHGGNR